MAAYYQETSIASLHYVQTLTENSNSSAYTLMWKQSLSECNGPVTFTLKSNSGQITDLVLVKSFKYPETQPKLKTPTIPISPGWQKFIVWLEHQIRSQAYGTFTLTFLLKNTEVITNSISLICMTRSKFPIVKQPQKV